MRERLDGQITRLLTDRGLDPEVIECSLERLALTVSDAEIAEASDEIRQTGTAPPALLAAAAEAGEACASR